MRWEKGRDAHIDYRHCPCRGFGRRDGAGFGLAVLRAGSGDAAGLRPGPGSQLILKCDKPGKHKVFAVIVTNTNLAAPMSDDQFESYPVTIRMDENSPWDDNWRFNDKFAMAVDQGNTRSLTRLLEKLDDASKMEVRLKPLKRSPTIIEFDVAGAADAIGKVYASCKDESPVG